MYSLETYLEKVIADMNTTWPTYELLRSNSGLTTTHPIPFFGDIKQARVLTIGVNPSADEFKKRDWPGELTASELNTRLQKYFVLEKIEAHKWFDTWQQAFEPLGVSYKGDAAHFAAHLDLSPRTTMSMGSAVHSGKGKLFIEMMKQDTRWFFGLLPECKNAKLMLASGSVTGRYYMDEFIECVAYKDGFKLEKPLTSRREGVGFNRLRGPGIDIPVFFSSVSPSHTQKKHELIDRVQNHKHRLLDLMNE